MSIARTSHEEACLCLTYMKCLKFDPLQLHKVTDAPDIRQLHLALAGTRRYCYCYQTVDMVFPDLRYKTALSWTSSLDELHEQQEQQVDL